MSKKMNRILVLAVVIIALTLVFVACSPDQATIESISVKAGQVSEYKLSDFNINKIILIVKDSNGTETERPATLSMLSDADAKQIAGVGEYEITFNYGGKTATFSLTILPDTTSGGTGGNNTSDYVTISFDTKGGTPSTISAILGTESASIATAPEVTKNGFTFGGWYTDDSFSNRANFPMTVQSDVVLYAKWDIIKVKITLEVGAADVNLGQSVYTIDIGKTFGNLPTNLVRTGYTFEGWFTSTGFAENERVKSNTAYTRDTTLYAKWTPARYSINYMLGGGNLNGGAQTDTYVASYTYQQTIKDVTPTRKYFDFVGWVDANGEQVNFSTMPAKDITVYAKWNIHDTNSFFSYTLNLDGTYTITGYRENEVATATTAITIPSIIDGVKVTAIGADAFKGKKALKSVVISEGITKINANAFYGTSITSDVSELPKTLEYIGADALPSSWEYDHTIGSSATVYYQFNFINTNSGAILVSYSTGAAGLLTIPSGVFRIAPSAFRGNGEITSIRFSDTIVYIDDNAFSGSTLSSIDSPRSATGLREVALTAFNNTPWMNANINNNVGDVILGSLLYKYCNSNNTNTVTVPAVKYIGASVYSGYTNLQNVYFANESIIESVGSKAFYKTKWAENQEFSIINGILTNVYVEEVYNRTMQVTLPETVSVIGANAFEYIKSKVKNIVVPSTVKKIDDFAFSDITSSNFKLTLLSNVFIGNELPTISPYAFARSAKLQSFITVDIYIMPQSLNTYIDEDDANDWNLLTKKYYTYQQSDSGEFVYDMDKGSYVQYNDADYAGFTRYNKVALANTISYVVRKVDRIDDVKHLATVYELGDVLDTREVVLDYTTNDGISYTNLKVNASFFLESILTEGVWSKGESTFNSQMSGNFTMTVSYQLSNSDEKVAPATFDVNYTIKRALVSVDVHQNSLVVEYFLNNVFSYKNNNPSNVDSQYAVMEVKYKIGLNAGNGIFQVETIALSDSRFTVENFVTSKPSSAQNVTKMTILFEDDVLGASQFVNVPYIVNAMSVVELKIEEYVRNGGGDYVKEYIYDEDGLLLRPYTYVLETAETAPELQRYVLIPATYNYVEDVDGLYVLVEVGYVDYIEGDASMDGKTRYSKQLAAAAYYTEYVEATHGADAVKYVRGLADYYVEYTAELAGKGERYTAKFVLATVENPYDGWPRYALNGLKNDGTNSYAIMEELDYANYFVTCVFDEKDTLTGLPITKVVALSDEVYNGIFFTYDKVTTETPADNIEGYIKYSEDVKVNIVYTVRPETLLKNFAYRIDGNDVFIYGLNEGYPSIIYLPSTVVIDSVTYAVKFDNYAFASGLFLKDANDRLVDSTEFISQNKIDTTVLKKSTRTVFAYDADKKKLVEYNYGDTNQADFVKLYLIKYDSLETVYVDKGITTLSRGIFKGTDIKAVYFNQTGAGGATLTEINDEAFMDTASLETINFGATNVVTKIGKQAFYNSSIGAFVLPKEVADIGAFAFSYSLVRNFSVETGSVLKNVGQFAFAECDRLNSAVLPDTVTYIGIGGFMRCDVLPSFRVPQGVTEILEQTFFECRSLGRISMSSGVTIIGEEAISNCEIFDTLMCYTAGELINVVTIKDFAFARNPYFYRTDVNPNTVEFVGEAAFLNDVRLDINFRNATKVRTISARAFMNTGIKGIYIGVNVDTIGENAFAGCSNVETIVIESPSFTEIGDYMFQSYTKLTTVILSNFITQIGKYAFAQTTNLKVTNPAATAGTPERTSFVLPSSIVNIGEGAFFESGISRLVFNDGLVSIGDYVFQGNTNITAITLPSSVKEVGNGAFADCINLQTLTIAAASKLVRIGNRAFYNNALTQVTLPVSIKEIGESAFEGCYALTTLSIPDGNYLISIGAKAFRDCISITDLALGESVNVGGFTIGEEAFARCYGLTVAQIPYSVSSIGAKVFFNCLGLKTVLIGAEFITIYVEATNAELSDAAVTKYVQVKTNDVTSWQEHTNQSGTKYVKKPVVILKKAVSYNTDGALTYGDYTRSVLTKMGGEAFANTTSLENVYMTVVNPYTAYNGYTGSGIRTTNLAAKHFGKYEITVEDGNTKATFLSHFRDASQVKLHIVDTTADRDNYTNWAIRSALNYDIYTTIEALYIA